MLFVKIVDIVGSPDPFVLHFIMAPFQINDDRSDRTEVYYIRTRLVMNMVQSML